MSRNLNNDIYHAMRLARDVGGSTNENPQVFMTDAQGRQYDAQGNPIQPAQTQAQSNSAATQAAPTPEQVGRRAAEDFQNARFSDFNEGGRVTGGNAYDNDQTVDRALALTREY